MAQRRLIIAARTDVGRIRPHNEDAIAISPELGFAILADGMGGYNAGEVASAMAVSGLKAVLEQGLCRGGLHSLRNRSEPVRQLLADGISQVNQAILTKAHRVPEYRGMGTTIVAAVFQGKSVTIAHVGDSRAYRFRQGGLVQLTRDHTWVQDQIEAGLLDAGAAASSAYKSLLTRAVGISPEVQADIHEHEADSADLYLLCSDGLTDRLSLGGMEAILRKSTNDAQRLCETLVRSANEAGGEDNISVVLMRPAVRGFLSATSAIRLCRFDS